MTTVHTASATQNDALTTSYVPAPADPAQRVELLDALRGFALFGVCLANLFVFAYWDAGAKHGVSPRYGLATDGWATYLMEALVEGKFYSIFSLLFGLGFALQLGRAEARGGDALPVYKRRVRILMLIGLAHLLLLWYGDILMFYALMAFVLMRMRHMDDKRALKWAVWCVLLPIPFYLPTLLSFMANPGMPFFVGAFGLSKLYHVDLNHADDEIFRLVTSGHIKDWFKLSTLGLFFRYGDLMFIGRPFKVLAMFLVGLVVGRRALWAHLEENAPLLKRVALWGYLVGLPASIAWASFKNNDLYYKGTWHGLIETILYSLAVAPLALAFAATFALLWRRDNWRRVQLWLAPAGKMALTNYLSQTVIATIIFSGLGFNMAGHIGPTWLWVEAIATLILQILFCRWWLRRYRFGPMEWVWRSLTYKQKQPMRITGR